MENGMSRRAAGVGFCFIAAFLTAARYLSAAVYGSSTNSWNQSLFNQMLQYVGNTLTVLSVISLIVGIVYLVMAERQK